VVIAIIVTALWGLGRRAVKGWLTAAVGLLVVIAYLSGVNVLALLLAAGLVVMITANRSRIGTARLKSFFPPLVALTGVNAGAASAAVPFSLALLFWTFLKIGAVLYGGGYVLLAFLRADLVVRLGWLTDRQLVDAIAIGQVTPGPLFTTATFVGYLLGGVPGALLATLAIFLPSFVFVALSSRLIPLLRGSPWAASFLDGVNVGSVGLMVGVTLQLSFTAIRDPLTVFLFLLTLALLLRYKVNSTWLILGGALAGLFHALLRF
jgi:chromate transporter